MDNKTQYDAFISYNHNPRDLKIAKELQTRLENYRVPKNLKLKNGNGRIERVFLDVGELGASPDLNNTIKEALDNTRFLIVICSPESKQSPWVHKEIEYFLMSHSLDRILTVISDGEPADVLPDETTSQETIDEDGTARTVKREPLSGDYRNDIKKAHKSELPRMVSAIIGCRYDDLVQRQKQYRMKQMSLLFGVSSFLMLATTAYVVWSNLTIKENYNNTLVEQSRNLAIQSEEALNKDDRIGAIELAIQALPETNERPVVPEAVYALAEATDVYKTPTSKRWVATKKFDKHDASVFKMTSYKNKTVLVELADNNRLAIYDAGTGTEMCEEYTSNLHDNSYRIDSFLFYDDSKLLILSSEEVIMYDLEAEKELYREKSECVLRTSNDNNVAIAGNSLWVVASRRNASEEKEEFVLLKIDVKSGKQVETISAGYEDVSDFVVSNDGKYLSYFVDTKDEDTDAVYIYDIAENKVITTIRRRDITDIDFDAANNLIICSIDSELSDENETAKAIEYSGMQGITISLTEDMTIDITYVSPKDAQVLWQKRINKRINGTPTADVNFGGLNDKNSVYKDKIFCVDNSLLMIINPDGKLEREIDFKSTITKLHYNPDSSDVISAILRNGNLATYSMTQNDIITRHDVFYSPVVSAETTGGSVYTRVYDSSVSYITKYDYEGYDPEFKEYSHAENVLDTFDVEVDSFADCFVEISGAGWSDNGRLITRHCKSGEIYLDKEYDLKDEDFSYRYAGIDKSLGKALFVGESFLEDFSGVAIDVMSGEKTKISFPGDNHGDDDSDGISYFGIGNPALKDEAVYILAERKLLNYETFDESKSMVLVRLNFDTEKREEYELADISEEQLERINDADKSIIDPHNEVLVTLDGDNLICYGFDGKKDWEIVNPISELKAMGCIDERLFIAGESDLKSAIHVFDIKNGKPLGSKVFKNGEGVLYSLDPLQLSEDEILIGGSGSYSYILDNDNYELRATVTHAHAYNPKEKLFAIGGLTADCYGCIPYRSLDELIDFGNSII